MARAFLFSSFFLKQVNYCLATFLGMGPRSFKYRHSIVLFSMNRVDNSCHFLLLGLSHKVCKRVVQKLI